MSYEVHQFKNAAGDVWYQVGRRRWFKIEWDAEWPWAAAPVYGKDGAIRFDTIEEAWARADELSLRDRTGAVTYCGPVGRPPASDDDAASSFVYAVASPMNEKAVTTETKPSRRPRGRGKKK